MNKLKDIVSVIGEVISSAMVHFIKGIEVVYNELGLV
jgi:hypothetical protein